MSAVNISAQRVLTISHILLTFNDQKGQNVEGTLRSDKTLCRCQTTISIELKDVRSSSRLRKRRPTLGDSRLRLSSGLIRLVGH